jgi:hypothetical protein
VAEAGGRIKGLSGDSITLQANQALLRPQQAPVKSV